MQVPERYVHWISHDMANALTTKINTINWSLSAQDVAPFLPATEQASLTLWRERFFADKVSKLMQALSADA